MSEPVWGNPRTDLLLPSLGPPLNEPVIGLNVGADRCRLHDLVYLGLVQAPSRRLSLAIHFLTRLEHIGIWRKGVTERHDFLPHRKLEWHRTRLTTLPIDGDLATFPMRLQVAALKMTQFTYSQCPPIQHDQNGMIALVGF